MSTPSPLEKEIQEPAPMNIATISAGFEKGDFLVREEQGNRVYFDFFEEVRKDRRRYRNCCLQCNDDLQGFVSWIDENIKLTL
jgi:hypothetical protein